MIHKRIFHIITTIIIPTTISILLSAAIYGSNALEPHVGHSMVKSPRQFEMEQEIVRSKEAAFMSYDEYEADLLARLIYHEAGADWIPDYVQIWVGSVVLNRVASDMYPDTIYEVIYDEGQYGPAITGRIDSPANERSIRIARELLEHGSVLPQNVLSQCGVEQGITYATYYDPVLDTTIYFGCL